VTVLESLLFGIFQGVTEFLPISSSGHLALLKKILKLGISEEEFLVYTVSVHAGTLLSVVFYFRREIVSILTRQRRVIWLLLIASVPASVVGYFGKPLFVKVESSLILLAVCFSVSALFLFAVPKEQKSAKDLASIKIPDAIFVGLAQGVGVLPGVSRSGSTVSTSLVRGIAPAAAVAFSLILGLISVGGATLLEARKIGKLAGEDALPLTISFIAALIVGLLCVRLLLLVSVRGRLRYFGYYLLALALFCAFAAI